MNAAKAASIERRFPVDGVTGQAGSWPVKLRAVLAWLKRAKRFSFRVLDATHAGMGDLPLVLTFVVQPRGARGKRRSNGSEARCERY
jgi:hypothetical protein